VVYVGSAEDPSKDQILEEVMVGPVPVGLNKFVLEADAPDPSGIVERDIIGVTVVLVTCSFKDQEFCRVGYYVNNEYRPAEGEEYDPEAGPPSPLDLNKISRQILADKPRVTRFNIDWGLNESVAEDSVNHQSAESLEYMTSGDTGPVQGDMDIDGNCNEDRLEQISYEHSDIKASTPSVLPPTTSCKTFSDEHTDNPFIIEDDEIMT